MTPTEPLDEFRTAWLPHITTAGISRLAELLVRGSPYLIRGAFATVLPMGCLATHAGWHHPVTASRNEDAGVCWLTKVAKLNPATSRVILAWDDAGPNDWDLRRGLLAECRAELARRAAVVEPAAEPALCGV